MLRRKVTRDPCSFKTPPAEPVQGFVLRDQFRWQMPRATHSLLISPAPPLIYNSEYLNQCNITFPVSILTY